VTLDQIFLKTRLFPPVSTLLQMLHSYIELRILIAVKSYGLQRLAMKCFHVTHFEFQRRNRSGGEGGVFVLRKCPFDKAYNEIM